MIEGTIKNRFVIKQPAWFQETANLLSESQRIELDLKLHEFFFSNKTMQEVEETIDSKQVSIVFHICAVDAENQVKVQTPTMIRNSGDYQHWRTMVFERDGYTCQHCGKVGGTLNAHHIKPFHDYPELRLALDNGITLCVNCHKLEHSKRVSECR